MILHVTASNAVMNSVHEAGVLGGKNLKVHFQERTREVAIATDRTFLHLSKCHLVQYDCKVCAGGVGVENMNIIHNPASAVICYDFPLLNPKPVEVSEEVESNIPHKHWLFFLRPP